MIGRHSLAKFSGCVKRGHAEYYGTNWNTQEKPGGIQRAEKAESHMTLFAMGTARPATGNMSWTRIPFD